LEIQVWLGLEKSMPVKLLNFGFKFPVAGLDIQEDDTSLGVSKVARW